MAGSAVGGIVSAGESTAGQSSSLLSPDSGLGFLARDALSLVNLPAAVGLTGLITRSLWRRFLALLSLAEAGGELCFLGCAEAVVSVSTCSVLTAGV